MLKNTVSVMFVVLIAFFAIGCSSGGNNPVQPQTEPENVFSVPEFPFDENQSNHSPVVTGMFIFDLETGQVEVQYNRRSEYHFEVSGYLPFPTVQLTNYDPLTGILDVDVTISNNQPLDGYDLRLIIYTTDNGVKLLNADDWTPLWDIPGGASINPFKAYAKNENQRIFQSQQSYLEHLQFYMPAGIDLVNFAIDASYPGNCDEPYSIQNFSQEILHDTVNSDATVEVDILDWQNDVDSVQLYCPTITGETLVDFTNLSGDKWRLNLINANAAPSGDYTAAVMASSINSGDMHLYDMIKIHVTENTLTEWTVLIYITEDDLGDRIQGDLNEMEVVGSPEGLMNVIVCWDKDASTDDVILKMEKDPEGYNDTIISPVIDDEGEVIPPGGLPHAKIGPIEDFIRWGMREFPAKKYGFIPFGHGNGPFRGSPDPEDFLVAFGGLQVWELRDAMQRILYDNPDVEKFEFVSMVSCLLSWIETAYTFKDVSKTVIASEWLMWASSFEYASLFSYVVDNIETMDANNFAAAFVTNYLENSPDPATLSAWDCSMIDTVAIPALNDFSQELIYATPYYRSNIISARTANGSWGAYCEDDRVKDLGLFADYLSDDIQLPQSLRDSADFMLSAIQDCMIESGHFGDGGTACPYLETGWQIWLPANYNDPDNWRRREDYGIIGFDNTLWDEFLAVYNMPTAPPVITHEENKTINNTGTNYTFETFALDADTIYWGYGSWDFTQYASDGQLTYGFIDPDTPEFLPFRPDYPDAQTVMRYPVGAQINYYPRYYDDSSSGFTCYLGSESDVLGPGGGLKYDLPYCIPYPMELGYSENVTASVTDLDNWTLYSDIQIAGYGAVTTGLGTFNCLLLRAHVIKYEAGAQVTEYISYEWINDSGKKIAFASSTSFNPNTFELTGMVTVARLSSID